LGFFIAALCSVAGRADRHIEHIHHEPGSKADLLAREAVRDGEDGWGETQVPIGFC